MRGRACKQASNSPFATESPLAASGESAQKQFIALVFELYIRHMAQNHLNNVLFVLLESDPHGRDFGFGLLLEGRVLSGEARTALLGPELGKLLGLVGLDHTRRLGLGLLHALDFGWGDEKSARGLVVRTLGRRPDFCNEFRYRPELFN